MDVPDRIDVSYPPALIPAEMERSVAGACLSDEAALRLVMELLEDRFDAFADGLARSVYRALYDDALDGEGPSMFRVANRLSSKDPGSAIALLAPLLDKAHYIDAGELRSACAQLLDRLRRRRLYQSAATIQSLANDLDTPVEEVTDIAQDALWGAIGGNLSASVSSTEGAEIDAFLADEARFWASGGKIGTPTGFYDLDRLIGGLEPGNLYLIAARPSMGKSALAINLISNLIFNEGAAAILFTFEMGSPAIYRRMISSAMRIPLSDIRSGRLSGDQRGQFVAFGEMLKKASLRISTGSSMQSIRAVVKHGKLQTGSPIGAVVVDYIGLMSGCNSENRNVEVSRYSRFLKELAVETQVPVIALSQLNRNLEYRTDKHPSLSDLRDSGQLEADADVVMFLHRPCVYDRARPPHEAELIVSKQRNGALGTVALHFQPQFASFANAERDYTKTPGDLF